MGAFTRFPHIGRTELTPDPEVVFGRGRALFRVADLLGLVGLLARLRQTQGEGGIR